MRCSLEPLSAEATPLYQKALLCTVWPLAAPFVVVALMVWMLWPAATWRVI